MRSYWYSRSKKLDRGKEVLNVQVEIKGINHKIRVHENDSPSQLAKDFCTAKKLPEGVCQSLSSLIDKAIEDLVLEEKYFSDPKHKNNVGARLYFHGVRRKNQIDTENETIRNLKELASFEETTFQPYLSPKTKKLTRFRSEKNVQERLYEEASTRKTNKKSYDERLLSLSFSPTICNSLNSKTKVFPKYRSLFAMMNPQFGRISRITINQEQIPQKVYKIISPFIENMEDRSCTLQEFSRFIDSIFAGLSLEDQNTLSNLPSDKNTDAFERLMSAKIFRQEKIKRLKRQENEKRYKECTFRPTSLTKLSK